MKAFRFFICVTIILCSLCLLTSGKSKKVEVREGSSAYGKIVYVFDGTYIPEGSSSYGTILFTVDDQYIRKGSSRYGDIVYTIDNNYIREGASRYNKRKLIKWTNLAP